MGTISIGGLATGLDTNSIVTQLTALERDRSITPLQNEESAANAKQVALQTFNTKVAAFLTAVNQLKDPQGVLIPQASSSDTSVLTVSAAAGALNGSTEITVNHLARPAIATAANGTATATATVATGDGTFAFRIGSTGPVQVIPIDATTTLDGLANSINALGAGVDASVVNVGTTATPDFRLRLSSTQTGVAQGVNIVTDDTTLGVSVTQTALDASFNVSGFSDPLSRDSNTVTGVIPGVTIQLASPGGPVTVAVANDTTAITNQVSAVISAFNDIVNFVGGESTISQDTSTDLRTVSIGPLALDSTVRGVLDSLHSLISSPTPGTSDTYNVLAQLGITTQRDGTLAFDTGTFATELAAHGSDVAKLFGGSDTTPGVADKLSDYVNAITQPGGLIDVHNTAIADQIRTLQDRVAAGQRNLDAFTANLNAQFVSLETLVSGLKSQSNFLTSAFGGGTTSSNGSTSG